MADFIIPTPDAKDLGNFFFDVDLDGVLYQLNFEYNEREEFWYFDILDLEGNEIRSGIKCVVNWPFLIFTSNPNRPAGQLLCLDARENSEDPTLDNFGIDVFFAYSEEVTVGALEETIVPVTPVIPLEIILMSRTGEVLKSRVSDEVLRSRIVI
jgi:hypothetical protein